MCFQYSPVGPDEYDFTKVQIHLPPNLEDLVTCSYNEANLSIIYHLGDEVNRRTREIPNSQISKGKGLSISDITFLRGEGEGLSDRVPHFFSTPNFD